MIFIINQNVHVVKEKEQLVIFKNAFNVCFFPLFQIFFNLLHLLIQFSKKKKGNGMGGLGTFGPCSPYNVHYKSRCGGCKGKGFKKSRSGSSSSSSSSSDSD